MNLASRIMVCASLWLAAMAASAADAPLRGTWSGSARYQDDEAELILRFEPDAQGTLIAYLSVPRTNVANAAIGKVERSGDEYRVHTARFHLDAATSTLAGGFETSGHDIAFTLRKHPASQAAAPGAIAAKKPAVVPAKPLWTFPTGGPVWSSPAFDGDSVYIGSDDRHVYALDARTGRQQWRFETGAAVVARPTIAGDALFVPSDDGYLYRLDARSGRQAWRFDTHGGAIPRVRPGLASGKYDYLASAATIVGGAVFVGSADGNLYAIDADSGKELWHYQTRDLVRSMPAVANGIVYFGSFDHNVYAVRARDGELAWKFDTGEIVNSSPVVADGKVYIGSRSADVFALDAATGKPVWKYFYWMSWVESSGTVRDGTLYIGSSDYQQLYALDAGSGHPRWSFDTDGSAWASPAVTDHRVYIGSVGTVGYMTEHHGGFFAVDRADGHVLWRYPMPPIAGAFAYGVASSPALGDGRVYFGGLDGNVYAFSESSSSRAPTQHGLPARHSGNSRQKEP